MPDGSYSYSRREEIYRTPTTTVSRAVLDRNGQRVILKEGGGESVVSLAGRLRHEHEMLSRFSIDTVVRPIALRLDAPDGPLLIMEDIGAIPLPEWIESGRTGLVDQITAAAALARGLAHVHERGVLHGDLSALNIVINPANGRINIVDFGGAAALALGAAVAAETLPAVEDLAAVAPERTGRMNRPVDHRADLYSLGAVLYQIFAGRPPFEGADRLALLHAHLARQPEPLGALLPAFPPVLSEIVATLLRKEAAARYRYAADLAADLERCRDSFEPAGQAGGRVAAFPIAAGDGGEAFSDESLYGRAAELEALGDAFEAARAGRSGFVLITGAPGIGKTALASGIKDRVAEAGGRFAIGKFEQLQRDMPHLGLAHCFTALVRGVLTEPDDSVAAWRATLIARLGRSAGALAELAPELERLIGPQPPAAQLASVEARHRLAQAVRVLIAAFAAPDHPLVLMLDDLQWADRASLELIGPICAAASSGGLLLIATSRDEGPDRAVLQDTLAGLDEQIGGLRHIALEPLAPEVIEAMLVRSHRGRSDQAAAAALVHAKTLGNPLFVRQLLTHLREAGAFSPAQGWDLDQIARVEATDNVIGFLAGKIRDLPPEARRVVAASACFGMQVEVASLAVLLDRDESDLRRSLDAAAAEGLMFVRADGYSFAHDRIREAAYQLATDRRDLHRRIGLYLIACTPRAGLPAAAFTIARHLNAAGDPGADPALRSHCAEINLIAARQARAAAAFGPARDYADTGLRLTDPLSWDTRYEEIAEAALLHAECRILTQDHIGFDSGFDELFVRLRDDERRLRLAILRMMSLNARALCNEAIDVGCAALRGVGIELASTPDAQPAALEAEFAEFRRLIDGRPAEALLDLPPLRDERLALAMQILFRLAPDAHNTLQPNLFALMALRNANLMLRHGSGALAPAIIITLALTLRAMTGDSVAADAFARTAIALDERLGHQLTASVTFAYTYFLQHWLHPRDAALPLNLDGIRAGFEMGDIQYGAYHAATYVIHLACASAALQDVARIGAEHLQIIGGSIRTASFHCQLEIDFAGALLGHTVAPAFLARGGAQTLEDVQDEVAALDFSERGYYFIRALQLAFLFGDFAAARRYADALLPILPGVAGNVIEADGVTFALLAALATDGVGTAQFAAQCDRLGGWSELNPHNFGAMHSLVEAELARIEDRPVDALRLYGDAVRRAEAGKLTHYTALANECAGRCCLALGDDVAAAAHLREAVALYWYWGARTKATALEREFPRLATRPRVGRASLRDAVSPTCEDDIDFRAVLQAARTISREIDLRRLVQSVLGAIQESAGAAYGVLVLQRDDGLHVEAIGCNHEISTVSDGEPERLDESGAAPQSILSYVLRTREALVLDNAQHSPEFSTDPYVRSRRVVSVLCAPLDERGQIDGLIYLENNLAAGVFSPRRLEVVQVLAAQAAIALANARLFTALDSARTDLLRANEGLERKVAERTAEFAEARNLALAKEREARRAERAAEAANQAKSRFLAVVSHEIRTPMNGVLGMLQILDRDGLAGEQRRYLEIAEESGRSLLELIDGILDYARLENDQEALDLRDFDLRRLVADTVELIRPQAAAKGLAIELTIDAPPETILRSDPRRLGRVLLNLLGNAVKFTAQGSIAVAVELEPAATAGANPTLRLQVKDSGIGIAPEMHERIFGEFIQADASIARRYGGTGLGLAICRRIADLLGGELTVESAAGAGSAFRLTAPVALSAMTPEAPTPIATGPALAVLVVDDDPINRAVAAGLLGRLGHRVTLADSGQAALGAAATARFDVVMMDLHMPGMDGLEATRRIRSLPGARPRAEIVALTADLTDGSRRLCALAGIERILAKPLQLAALQRMLANVSGSDCSLEQPQAAPDPTALIDDDFFAERYDVLGIAELARLALMFHRVSRPMIGAIEAAVASSDRRELGRVAHRLRSSAGALGLARLAGSAAAIEARVGKDASIGSLEDMAAGLPPLRQSSIKAFLAKMRRSASQPRASVRIPSL